MSLSEELNKETEAHKEKRFALDQRVSKWLNMARPLDLCFPGYRTRPFDRLHHLSDSLSQIFTPSCHGLFPVHSRKVRKAWC